MTDQAIQVEEYIPGREFALEGLVSNGRLQVLAIFDKPDPLEGPFFEETIYLTPSSAPRATQRAIVDAVVRAAEALGFWHGPIHAECRVNADGVFVLRASHLTPEDLATALQAAHLRLGEGVVGRAGATRAPFEVADVEASDLFAPNLRELLLAHGHRSVLAVPLLRDDHVLGGLAMARRVMRPSSGRSRSRTLRSR